MLIDSLAREFRLFTEFLCVVGKYNSVGKHTFYVFNAFRSEYMKHFMLIGFQFVGLQIRNLKCKFRKILGVLGPSSSSASCFCVTNMIELFRLYCAYLWPRTTPLPIDCIKTRASIYALLRVVKMSSCFFHCVEDTDSKRGQCVNVISDERIFDFSLICSKDICVVKTGGSYGTSERQIFHFFLQMT